MRLVYVAYSPLDLQSANSIQTFNTVRELASQLGDQLQVIVPRFGANEATLPFPVVKLARIPINKLSRIWQNGWWSYFERTLYAWRVVLRLRQAPVSFDFIYTRDLMCAYWLARSGMPVMYEVHDLEARHPGQSKGARLKQFLARADEQTLRGARGVASLTEAFRQELIRRGWQTPARIFIIPDAYDDRIYFPRERGAARAALGLERDALIVTYAGLTFKYRGLDLLLRAFHEWGEPRASLVLVGGRAFEIKELLQEAERLKIKDLVKFVGRKEAPAIAQYLAAADVLVIPDTVTDASASPLKMFEYMAMARPIVAVDRASLREILSDDGALWFPPGDVAAFADALRRASLPDAAGIAANAHARASEFTYARRAARIIDAAQRIIDD